MKSLLFDFLSLSLVLVFSIVLVPVLVSVAKLPVNEVRNTLNLGVIGVQSVQNESALGMQNGRSVSTNEANNAQDVDTNRIPDTQQNSIAFCVEPKSLTVKEGDVFNVSVAIENIPVDPGVAGAEFHLSWDQTVLNAVTMQEVMFQDNSIGWDELNNTDGILTYVHASCGKSIAGNQTLAIITYQAISKGSTAIHFTFVDASSPSCSLFDGRSVDGNVTVEEGNGTIPIIPSSNASNVVCTITIMAGSAIENNTLIVPAVATLNVPFSVNIEIANATDMFGWSFELLWNTSVLNCTSAEIYNPDTWQETFSIGGEINNNYNSTHGYYLAAVVAHDSPSYNGNMVIATLTFNPIGTGTTPLPFGRVQLCDHYAIDIPFSTTIGSITVNED
jgi:hypothetical protein